MKIFLIKSLVIFFTIITLFKLTIGSTIKNIEKKLDAQFSKEKIILIKEKTREELRKGINKDRILNIKDAELVGKFIRKILGEINKSN